MNAQHLRRTRSVVLAFSLWFGVADLARGQTPAEAQAAQAAIDELNARRQADLMKATSGTGPAFGFDRSAKLSPSTVSATTITAASGEIPALRVAVSSIDESRNDQGRGRINLALSIIGEGLPPLAVVKQITVTKAVDNLGNVLASNPSAGGGMPASLGIGRMMLNVGAGQRDGRVGLTARASLIASVRKAESLKYAEGTIELYLPSEASGSVIRIPNVLSHAGRIEDPALAKHGIEFYFLPNQESYDEAKKQVAGFHDRPPIFRLRPNVVAFSYRDPLGSLAFPQLQESNGTVIPSNGFSEGRINGSTTGDIQLLAPLPADGQLVLFLAIPETFKTVPFRVEDIVLP